MRSRFVSTFLVCVALGWVRAEPARAQVATGDLPIANSSQQASDLLAQDDPGRDRLNLGLQFGEFTLGLGSRLREPTVLEGTSREEVVDAASSRIAAVSVTGFARQQLSARDRLLLESRVDPQALGLDFSYTREFADAPGEISVNVSNQRSLNPAFQEGERDVDLPDGDAPWVHRLGGGVEYFRPVTPALSVAAGATYEVVSVRSGAFTSDLETEDELGNPLTFSDDGIDQHLALKVAMLYDNVDNPDFPTAGTTVRAGFEQEIAVGDSGVSPTRLSGNVSQFIPLDLFGFTEGPRVLVLNAQAGTILGDVAPYDAFSLGGSSTVRGFNRGELATGSSFVQASVEYRFPIAGVTLLSTDVDLGGTLFVDYGSDLGTDDDVLGNPAAARDKDGSAFGYGLGAFARLPFGRLRVEYGLNSRGGSTVHFAVGDRF